MPVLPGHAGIMPVTEKNLIIEKLRYNYYYYYRFSIVKFCFIQN